MNENPQESQYQSQGLSPEAQARETAAAREKLKRVLKQ